MRRTCQGPSRPRPWHDSARLTVSARYVELCNCSVRVIEGTDHVLPGARGSGADAGVRALSMTPAGIPGGPRLVERSAAGVVTRRRQYSRQAVLPVVAGGDVVRAVPRDGTLVGREGREQVKTRLRAAQ